MLDLKDKLWVPRLLTSQMIGSVKKKIHKPDESVYALTMEKRPEEHLYPRPQMVRDSYFDLNGIWEIAPMKKTKEADLSLLDICCDHKYRYTIRVPFAPQAALSEYKGPLSEAFVYHKMFTLPEGFVKDRTLLHFGAVDQIAEVYLNGECIGRHEGGYLPFSYDITEALIDGENELHVYVEDRLDTTYPYGKQTKTPGGMWYTEVSGIWQSVWIESVPEEYIKSVTCNYKEPYVEVVINGTAEEYTMQLHGKIYHLKNGQNKLYINHPKYWTPDDPYLYEFELETEEDRISSYFAIRTITIESVDGRMRMCLNHKPYFFHGVLDQGYFPDGLFTPRSDHYYEDDIRNMKELGFNTLRKHIKIEPQVFYHACDRIGMLVFQDMVNNGVYDYNRDTLMPTAGKKYKDDTVKEGTETQHFFCRHARDTVKYLKSFPSIVLYTIFNEGWGQFNSEMITERLKQIDDTRLYDSVSGWFLQGSEEIFSDHVYFHKVWPMKKGDIRPRLISECGGYARAVEGHMYCPGKSYGYGTCESEESLTDQICRLYEEEIFPEIEKGCCGAIYTQVSDIEEEINGLYTYDRAVCKVDKQRMKELVKW